jgi:thymidylate synthase
MKQYLDALSHVLSNGTDKTDRTGVGTRSVFGYQMRFNLQDGFPAVTTKRLAWKAAVSELLWFIEGSGNERRLAEILHNSRDADKQTIWTANAQADYWKPNAKYEGDLGRVYGVQWRDWRQFKMVGNPEGSNMLTGVWNHIDQFENLIHNIKNNPDSRRHILSAWNVADLDNMALPPCHVMSQFDVTDGKLSCQLYQRSADMFLGVPFNIASYSLLTHIIANECNLDVGDFVWTGGDCHIYQNHMEQVKEQLTRKPQSMPTLNFPKDKKIADFVVDDFVLVDYDPMPSIKAPMAV